MIFCGVFFPEDDNLNCHINIHTENSELTVNFGGHKTKININEAHATGMSDHVCSTFACFSPARIDTSAYMQGTSSC